MKIAVKGPDVNESDLNFSVTKDGGIRFGLGGIKGVGEAAVEGIVAEREKNGPYKDIYDFVERVNLSQVNRRTLESLAIAGAFDSFKDLKRSQFIELCEGENISFSEALGKYGQRMKSGGNVGANSLFGDTVQVAVKKPQPSPCEEWSDLIRLNKEKELVGIYLSAHPLDQYKLEINTYCNATMAEMSANDESLRNKNELRLAGIVTAAAERTTKTGNPWGQLTVEDFSGSHQFAMFSKDYMQYKSFFSTGYAVLIKGKMQARYNNPEEFEFRISSIEFLSDMKDKMLNSITLSLPVTDISQSVISMLHKISASNKGHSTLEFNIYDPKTNVKIKMRSRSCRVRIDNSLISELDRQNINYEIK